MRLGGVIHTGTDDPQEWIKEVKAAGYRATNCPLNPLDDYSEATLQQWRQAADHADIVIAEVGAWSNPLSLDDETRNVALNKCQRALDLADRIGARCAVNIVGSLGEKWDGPCALDLTDEAFERIVVTVREIIDAVKPTRSVYALETMPWMYPDSADSYLKLIKAIDRPKCLGVHLDPVNIINCPERYFRNADLLRECFAKLGSMIVSVHAKDILIGKKLTLHLDEVRPGLGNLDYRVYLQEMAKLHPDTPMLLEHLPNMDEYHLAAEHIRGIARAEGISI